MDTSSKLPRLRVVLGRRLRRSSSARRCAQLSRTNLRHQSRWQECRPTNQILALVVPAKSRIRAPLRRPATKTLDQPGLFERAELLSRRSCESQQQRGSRHYLHCQRTVAGERRFHGGPDGAWVNAMVFSSQESRQGICVGLINS